MSQALASLTATYTDSEGEEDMEDGQSSPEKIESPQNSRSFPSTPKTVPPTTGSVSLPGTPGKTKRLVSYNNDDVISDDEAPPVDHLKDRHIKKHTDDEEQDDDEPVVKPEIVEEDGITIPPAPPGKCSAELQEKIASIYAKMVSEGKDMNQIIQRRKDFRNPSIYEKLIEFCKINELDTNYPPEIYDPLRWGKESYFEELAKAQKTEMDRRDKERQEKIAKIDFKTGFVKKVESEEDAKKRKSKWDQAAPNSSTLKPPVKPAGVVQPALTTSASGTKSTVIPAFGSLPKRPRM